MKKMHPSRRPTGVPSRSNIPSSKYSSQATPSYASLASEIDDNPPASVRPPPHVQPRSSAPLPRSSQRVPTMTNSRIPRNVPRSHDPPLQPSALASLYAGLDDSPPPPTSTQPPRRQPVEATDPRLPPQSRPSPSSALSPPAPAHSQWGRAPTDTCPCEPAHDRPVFCLSVDPARDTIVSGSADHGLRVFSLSGQLQRELYTRDSGHKEWVTTCTVLPSGTVLSGSIDGAACIWPRASTKCGFLGPHGSGVTRVAGNDAGLALTSSMDGALRLWAADLSLAHRSGPARVAATRLEYREHGAGVTTFHWGGGRVASGDRGGGLRVWDVEAGETVAALRGHKRMVHSVFFIADQEENDAVWDRIYDTTNSYNDVNKKNFAPIVSPNMVVSGAADGYFQVHDLRQPTPVSCRQVSGSKATGGSVTDIAIYGCGPSSAAIRGVWGQKPTRRVTVRGRATDSARSASGPADGEVGDHSGCRGDLVGNEITARASVHQYTQSSSTRSAGDFMMALATAEGRVALVDPRMSYRTVCSMAGHDGATMAVRFSPCGRYILSTGSEGNLLCHDALSRQVLPRDAATGGKIPTEQALWGMGVTQGPISEEARAIVGRGSGGRAVGCLEVWEDGIVCAGDDGTPLILRFK